MKFRNLIPAEFVVRLNRFVCIVRLDGKEEKVLLRNTGRLKELLIPGRRVYVRHKNTGICRYELILVETDSSLVCVDSHLPPRLLVEYLLRNSDPWRVSDYRYEFKLNSSRFDLLLNQRILVETKSVNLVVNSIAMFPDAPTKRGRKHIEELMKNVHSYEPAIVFVVQREDACKFSPNHRTDPEFARFLRNFHSKGHTVKAFVCKVSVEEIFIWKEIPVIFETQRRW